jgi:hypothetical protein
MFPRRSLSPQTPLLCRRWAPVLGGGEADVAVPIHAHLQQPSRVIGNTGDEPEHRGWLQAGGGDVLQ